MRNGLPDVRSRGERHPQLDGLRAFAVLAVVAHHTAPPKLFAAFGEIGVTCFFTLSAYLITGILLRARGSLGDTLRAFYARRAVRIVPAYYALLVVLLLANTPALRATWWWHAAYLSNWLVVVLGEFPPVVGHFWTLAIEEQFYLFWPLVVLVVPRRRLGLVCVTMATLALVTRATVAMITHSGARALTPTFSALDALAVGALLAWSGARARWPVAVVGLIVTVVSACAIETVAGVTMERLGIALVSVWLIDRAVRDRLPAVFTWRPLRWVGTISYGVYLWHPPIAWAIQRAVRDEPMAREISRGSWTMFVVVLALTLAVASLSWMVLERPVDALKRRFPYPGEDPVRVHPIAA